MLYVRLELVSTICHSICTCELGTECGYYGGAGARAVHCSNNGASGSTRNALHTTECHFKQLEADAIDADDGDDESMTTVFARPKSDRTNIWIIIFWEIIISTPSVTMSTPQKCRNRQWNNYYDYVTFSGDTLNCREPTPKNVFLAHFCFTFSLTRGHGEHCGSVASSRTWFWQK